MTLFVMILVAVFILGLSALMDLYENSKNPNETDESTVQTKTETEKPLEEKLNLNAKTDESTVQTKTETEKPLEEKLNLNTEIAKSIKIIKICQLIQAGVLVISIIVFCWALYYFS